MGDSLRRLIFAAMLSAIIVACKPLMAAEGEAAAILMENPRAVANVAFVSTIIADGGAPAYAVVADQASDKLFRQLYANGVGLIRLVVNPTPLFTDDDVVRARAMDQILLVVDQILSSGLHAIIDFHNWPPGDPSAQSAELVSNAGQRARFERALIQMARQLDLRPKGTVGLELLNEPGCRFMTDFRWPEMQASVYEALRQQAPLLPLILKGCNDGDTDLIRLDISSYRKDPNAIFSFHYYEPFIFTHQSTYYRGTSFRLVPFPPAGRRDDQPADYFMMPFAKTNAASVNELIEYLRGERTEDWYVHRIQRIGQWADGNGIPRYRVFLGEFGVNLKPGPDTEKIWPDILHWLHMVSRTASNEGFTYSLWPPIRQGGLYDDPTTHFARSDIISAVGWGGRWKRNR